MEEPLRKLGPYKLIRKIGRGAFAVVWLAEKRTAITATQVALKVPRDEEIDLEAFKQEAAIWVQASGHENVVSLIEADIYDGQVVIVSEYVPDGSLGAWLHQHSGKAPSIESACKIIDGVLSGLVHLHNRRIIHRDLKPDNILLRRDKPMLADFGIARLLQSGSYSSNISGTLAYMAPEAFDNKRNERTDIWAVGVIFYQLLAGQLPFPQKDQTSLIGAITRFDPPALPESLPESLRRAVAKALQRDPARRYDSAAEMRNDLRDAERQRWLDEHKPGDLPITSYDNANGPSPAIQCPDMISSNDRLLDPSETIGAVTSEQQGDLEEATRTASRERGITRSRGRMKSLQTTLKVQPALIGNLSPVPSIPAGKQMRFSRKAIAYVDKGLPVIFLLSALSALSAVIWISIKFGPAPTPSPTLSPRSRPATRRDFEKPMTNKMGMEFFPIPAGKFLMGSDSSDKNEEKPAHWVTIERPFYMGLYEVTQGQWQAVMGNNPSHFKDCGSDCPVEQVSWNDAQDFITKLNEANDGYKYRLPSESEWEYACRAGTTGEYYASDVNTIGWYESNSINTTHPVGRMKPNNFGLYDMSGNVWEWCQDFFLDSYLFTPRDGSPVTLQLFQDWRTRGKRVVRGGSWYTNNTATVLRSAYRGDNGSDAASGTSAIGFRVVAVTVTP